MKLPFSPGQNGHRLFSLRGRIEERIVWVRLSIGLGQYGNELCCNGMLASSRGKNKNGFSGHREYVV